MTRRALIGRQPPSQIFNFIGWQSREEWDFSRGPQTHKWLRKGHRENAKSFGFDKAKVAFGAWLGLVERTIRVREVESSNLHTPTKLREMFTKVNISTFCS